MVDPPLLEAPPAPEPEPRPSRRRGLTRLLAFFLVLGVLFSVGALYVRAASRGSASSRPVTVVIPQGAAFSRIADILAQAGVVKTAWLFKFVGRMDDRSRAVKAGTYSLRTGMSYSAALAALAAGPVSTDLRLTIPEGKTLREIASLAESTVGLSAAALVRAATSGAHRLPIMPAASKNLEGLLFPETYSIPKDATEDDVVQSMLDQFTKATGSLDFTRAKAYGITPYQAVVVASMVEREARTVEDRPKIARVIYNRIARGMRLQIDATVQYAILQRTGSYKSRLTYDDYKIDSPYNTYQISGLPPAPIASPGLAALQAALNPAATDAIYYVLCGADGSHAFARTAEEFDHLKARCRSARG